MPTTPITATRVLYTCDAAGCDKQCVLLEDEALEWPWRTFEIDRWIGHFVACSDTCEARVRRNPDPP